MQLWEAIICDGARLPCGNCFGDNPSPVLSLVPLGLQWNLIVWCVVGTL